MTSTHPGLYKRGRYWHFILSVNGQRSHGSTRATDLVTAKKVLEAKRRELIEGQLNRLPKTYTTVSLVREWLRVNRATFSDGHFRSAECSLRRWVFPVIGEKLITQVALSDAMEIRARMLEAGCSPTYVNNAAKALNAVFNYALQMRYIREFPYRLPKMRVQRKPRVTLPAGRVKEFLETLDSLVRNHQLRVLVRVMLGLGLREAEALGMRWEWFDLQHRTYTVGRAKGKEARVIPVPDWLWHTIYQQPRVSDEWVFPAQDGRPHRAQFSKKALQRACHAMNLGKLTAHRLRATFATIHAQLGTPITEIQGMLGHKSVTTTMIYVETDLEAKRKAQCAIGLALGLSAGSNSEEEG